MSDQVLVRDVKWEDFEQIAKNFFSYFDELKENPDLGLLVDGKKPNMSQEVDWFAGLYKKILEGDAVASVAEIDGKIVGLCDINRVTTKTDIRHNAIGHRGILGITVLKEYRGIGIGTKLIKSCVKKAKRKFEIVSLTAFENNAAAVRLYEKCGFKKYGTGRGFIKRGKRYINEYMFAISP